MDLISTQGPPAGDSHPAPPRRNFLRRALGLGAAAGLAARPAAAWAQAAPVVNDPAILNFALNLEYLGASYYTFAVTGTSPEVQGLPTGGSGTPGPYVIKPNPKVPFASAAVAQYAMNLAVDEQRHLLFFRNTLTAFGVQPVRRPTIDLLNSFNMLAGAAGLPTPFDPFANDLNFLLGAYILEDTCVSFVRGGAALLKNANVIDGAAGILGVEGTHAALIRTTLFQMGQGPATDAISGVRQALGGGGDYGVDDGPLGAGPKGTASIALVDANALVLSRTVRQVLNILYGAVNAPSGGFFPTGLNGPIR